MNHCSVATNNHKSTSDYDWLKLLFNDFPYAIFIAGEDFRLLDANKATLSITGFTMEELKKSDIRNTIFRNNHKQFSQAFERDASGKTFRAETEILKKDGSLTDIEANCRRLKHKDKVLIICTAREINRSGEAESALRKLSYHSEQVREEERSRIALDLHDDLGQRMTALKMDVAWLRSRIANESETILGKLNGMLSLIDDTVKTIQKISSDLRPGILYDIGLPAAIEWHLANFSENTGIESVANIIPEEFEIDEKMAIAIYRIIQEALTNTARHSGADIVSVSVIKTGNRIKVTIRDNGSGICEEQILNPDSFGIFGMKERARLFGGELRVKGAQGKGTSISVEFNTDFINTRHND